MRGVAEEYDISEWRMCLEIEADYSGYSAFLQVSHPRPYQGVPGALLIALYCQGTTFASGGQLPDGTGLARLN